MKKIGCHFLVQWCISINIWSNDPWLPRIRKTRTKSVPNWPRETDCAHSICTIFIEHNFNCAHIYFCTVFLHNLSFFCTILTWFAWFLFSNCAHIDFCTDLFLYSLFAQFIILYNFDCAHIDLHGFCFQIVHILIFAQILCTVWIKCIMID